MRAIVLVLVATMLSGCMLLPEDCSREQVAERMAERLAERIEDYAAQAQVDAVVAETEVYVGLVLEAALSYFDKNASAETASVDELIEADLLNEAFRNDSWGNEIVIEREDDVVRVISVGADGVLGSADDISEGSDD